MVMHQISRSKVIDAIGPTLCTKFLVSRVTLLAWVVTLKLRHYLVVIDAVDRDLLVFIFEGHYDEAVLDLVVF